MLNGFKVITLCGSTRFKNAFKDMAEHLTLKGNIVLMPNVFSHNDNLKIDDKTNEMLLNIHKAKIDISDCILVINIDNYIGKNTQKEIDYAISRNKEIKYLVY